MQQCLCTVNGLQVTFLDTFPAAASARNASKSLALAIDEPTKRAMF
jgi:hypothetical protein